MKLLSLKSDHSSFHPVIFKDGVNIIVGKQVAPHNENDGNTYNGVGKSLTLHLIHFCLGSNSINSLAAKLPEWKFTLEFEIDGKRYTSTRDTKEQNKIDFCGERISVKEMRETMLELCFGITSPPKNLTWNTLFARFARRSRSSYTKYDSFTTRESDYSKLLNNCYLLGIDIDLIVSKKCQTAHCGRC